MIFFLAERKIWQRVQGLFFKSFENVFNHIGTANANGNQIAYPECELILGKKKVSLETYLDK